MKKTEQNKSSTSKEIRPFEPSSDQGSQKVSEAMKYKKNIKALMEMSKATSGSCRDVIIQGKKRNQLKVKTGKKLSLLANFVLRNKMPLKTEHSVHDEESEAEGSLSSD